MLPPRLSTPKLVLAVVTAAALLAPSRMRGQEIFDAKSAAHVRNAYLADMDTLHAKVLALAKAIPAEKYSWRPSPEVRTISEVFIHIAGEWYLWMPRAFAANPAAEYNTPPKVMALEKTLTTKPQVLAELEKAWTYGRKEVAAADASKLTGNYKPYGVGIDAASLIMADDLHEHLGQLIVYARSVGVKPPWSK